MESTIGSLSEQLNVTRETVVLLFCLISSIPLAALTRLLPSQLLKSLYSTVAGLVLCHVAYGGIYASTRLLAPTVLTFLIIRHAPRHCGYIVYVAAFAYLLFCHAVSMSADSWRKGGVDFTGTLMIFTLKLVACAMDVQDGHRVKGEEAKQRMYATRLEKLPSLIDFLGFVYFPGSVIAGPVFDFKSYRAYVRGEEVWARGPGNPGPPSAVAQACTSLVKVLVTLVGYQTLISYFPAAFMTSQAFFHLPLAQRWAYAIIAGFAFRWMYYFIWSVAEVAMVVSELGYSGPSDSDPLWSRAVNANIVKVEFTASASQMPAFWNIWVGRWLRTYVYDRLTPLSGKPTLWTLVATQLVSALWHGLHPGYYLFFLSASVAQNASKVVYRAQQVIFPQAGPAIRQTADVAQMLFKIVFFNYCVTGFLLLRADQTLEVWRSLYFLGTIIPLAITIVVPYLTPKPRKKKD